MPGLDSASRPHNPEISGEAPFGPCFVRCISLFGGTGRHNYPEISPMTMAGTNTAPTTKSKATDHTVPTAECVRMRQMA